MVQAVATPTSPAPAHISRSASSGRGAAPSGVYGHIVCNAGALKIGDVVFWERARITAIHRQTESSCDCELEAANGTTRRITINSVNALIVVTAGPTLAAANLHYPNLKCTPVGSPIYRVERV